MNIQKRTTVIFGAVLLVCNGGLANGYELVRWTVDTGGSMRSGSAGFVLSGTVGQPDAGEMSGGGFDLVGGFWFGEPPGDCDATGIVDLLDYEEFFACQSVPGVSPSDPECDCLDLDSDGDIDLRDFSMLMQAFES